MARRLYLGGRYSKRYVVVDDIDYDYVMSLGLWCALTRRRRGNGQLEWKGYVQRSADGYRCPTRLLHRIIAERALGPCPPGYTVDHINGNTKDNRRCNLRYATNRENSSFKRGKSGRGYFKCIDCERDTIFWVVPINGATTNSGPRRRCGTENEARLVANLVRHGYHIPVRRVGVTYNGRNTGRRTEGRSN